jgi:hypothetical protein
MRISSAVLLAALVGSVSNAYAYIPPSEYIVRQFVKKRAGVTSIRIRSIVTAIEGSQATAVRYRLMTQLELPSRKIRVRAYDETGKELYATWRELPVDAGVASDPDRLRTSPVFEFLADPRAEVVVGTLVGLEIPIRTEGDLLKLGTEEERRSAELTSLTRVGDEVAWMIGPARKAAYQPQVWFEKDSFLPLRWIGDTEQGRLDIRLQSYRFTREYPFPRVIEIRQADSANKALYQELVQDFWINPEGNEMSRGFAGDGFTEAGNAAGSVRDLILSTIKVLR